MLQLVFVLISAAVLGFALMVVTSRNLFHSALFLAASFLAMAGLFVLLEAEFLAVVQILVYVGAISTLIVFAIMLSRGGMQPDQRSFNDQWPGVAVGAALLAVFLVMIVTRVPWKEMLQPLAGNLVAELGAAFVGRYVIPFEVASLLLVVAMIGAILIARERE
ncbi:MAG: NADH-quinone oxidoreductase subunit J [Anaerolineae bacterium]